MLTPVGVIAIRKLYQDPTKKMSPLYVLTFLGKKCPDKIKAGYSSIQVDTFYPSPLQCKKCYIFGHHTHFCSGAKTCRNCGKKGHLHSECTALEQKCRNCKNAHDATSKLCDIYKKELEICKVKATRGISFEAARKIVSGDENENGRKDLYPAHTRTVIENSFDEDFPEIINTQARRNKQQQETNTARNKRSTTKNLQNRNILSPSSQEQISHGLNESDEETEQLEKNCSLYSQALNKDKCEHNSTPQYHRLNNMRSQNCTNDSNLQNIAVKFIPLLIKLFFNTSVTSRIECFLEIGSLLKSEKIVHEILENLGLSSFPSTQ